MSTKNSSIARQRTTLRPSPGSGEVIASDDEGRAKGRSRSRSHTNCPLPKTIATSRWFRAGVLLGAGVSILFLAGQGWGRAITAEPHHIPRPPAGALPERKREPPQTLVKPTELTGPSAPAPVDSNDSGREGGHAPEADERGHSAHTDPSASSWPVFPSIKGASGLSECERTALGWEKYRSWMKSRVETVCEGFSTLRCVTFPYHNPGRAFFCFGTNLVEERHGERLKWLAYCQRTPVWHRHGFWDEMGVSRPLYSDDVGGLNVVGGEPAVAGVPEAESTFTYVARTDCPNMNPAHCQADPQLGFLIRSLMNVDREEARLVLALPGMSQPYGWQAGFQNVRMSQEEAVRRDHKKKGGSDADEAHADHDKLLLKQVAFSPGPMYAPHWQGNRDDKGCEGRSDILIDYQLQVLPVLTRSLKEQEGRVAGGFCEWLGSADEFKAEIPGGAHQHELHRTALKAGQCDTSSGSPIAKRGVVLILNRHNRGRSQDARTLGNGRLIRNLDAMVRAIEQISDIPVVVVNPGHEAHLLQFALVASARIVVGMHGGALWGAARWMSDQQAMVEILPIRGPGDTCLKAKMFGSKYVGVVCPGCRGADKSGEVDVKEVADVVKRLLHDRKSVQETSCSAIPGMTR